MRSKSSFADPLGNAVWEYHNGERNKQLWINTSYGEPEEMPIEVYFRDFDGMPELEQIALDLCDVSVLDVGACTGAHSLFLQGQGHEVTAVDNSKGCIKTLHERGVKIVIESDFFELPPSNYGTILMMMNGLGLAGKLDGLGPLLKHCESLLRSGGFILADSSDISYLLEGGSKPEDRYFGEVSFQFDYAGQLGKWFDWLYVDFQTLSEEVSKFGWSSELICASDDDAYLMRMWTD
ncbi:MAG: class I SAM-dependent methyltransferase [Bacteroidota bacterium]